MKKTLAILLVIAVLIAGLFILTGCENGGNGGNQPVNKNVDTFEVEAKFGGKLSFEMPKDTGYTLTTDTNKGTLKHGENDSTITLYLMDTSKSSIIMKETDFSSSSYSDYQKIEVNGHEAYTIKKSNNFSVTYGILMDEYDKDHGKYHGVKIEVSKINFCYI